MERFSCRSTREVPRSRSWRPSCWRRPAIGLVAAQGGDQFLDGIGETALVARYLFNGNAEDSSRNHLHATLRGSGAAYVEDARFGRALELAGNGSYVQLPGHALAGEDADQRHWLALPADRRVRTRLRLRAERLDPALRRRRARPGGFSAGFAAGEARGGTEPASVPVNQWVHLAVVLDPANRLLTTYLDGASAGQATNVGVNAAQLISQAAADANRLFLGRSQDDGDADASREAAGRPRVSRGVDRRPGGGDQQRRVGPPGRARPGRGSGPGDLDRRHSQGIPAGVAARTGPRHPGRDDRGPAPAAAARDPGRVPRPRRRARRFA